MSVLIKWPGAAASADEASPSPISLSFFFILPRIQSKFSWRKRSHTWELTRKGWWRDETETRAGTVTAASVLNHFAYLLPDTRKLLCGHKCHYRDESVRSKPLWMKSHTDTSRLSITLVSAHLGALCRKRVMETLKFWKKRIQKFLHSLEVVLDLFEWWEHICYISCHLKSCGAFPFVFTMDGNNGW